MARKIAADPRWHGGEPAVHHAVAFPGTDRASLGGDGRPLGPDAPAELILDRSDLASDTATAAALARVTRYWSGDSVRDRVLTDRDIEVIGDVVEPEVVLRALLRSDIEEGERELRAPTQMQLGVLRTLQRQPRASIVGCAGAGKSLLAIEKARRLAVDGFDTVLACFNQPLARAFARTPELVPHIESGRLVVGTFHDLCRRLATEAGTLPPQPANPGRDWFETELPKALERALPSVGGRAQAVVIDEGQDFDELWLLLLAELLADPKRGVLYVFHDPAQAIYRPDAVGALGLEEYPLPDNCRNARPIHDLAYRFYDGALQAEAVREDGRDPLIVTADGPEATVDALREVLGDLVHREKVARSQVAVLTGVSLEHSAAWRQRRFKGDLLLWNGGVDDEGRSRGLSADEAPDQPADTILCESIYRFKGLERDVVVLVELRPDDARLDRLLYVGATRAKHHLVVIAPPALADRLRLSKTD
jgi:superfamily I DNA/RNA helicase